MNDDKVTFVDSNVFLRFLTNDDPSKAEKVKALFEKAIAGEVQLTTSLLVIAEIVWTLESFYRLERADIADKVETILSTPNLDCPEVDIILPALDFYATRNVDFVDAYHAFWLKTQGLERILTYDRKHFGRVKWLEILEP
ncbi:MAG TPA: type II toxin-antitoxin system VapC family toxin [Acidobacteriota bacterium]|nr:type II toxin-antitoxin system VapC family toxin [Acidobacteriota bacterium]